MYTPQAGDEGMGLFMVALRDYLVADATILELLPNGAASILPEGFFTNDTPTPAVVISMIGDGESAWGVDAQLVRLMVNVLDRGRGYHTIERVLRRIRRRINDTQTAMEYLTYTPGTSDHSVLHIEAPGSSTSATYPNWNAEGRALYVFAHLAELPTAQ